MTAAVVPPQRSASPPAAPATGDAVTPQLCAAAHLQGSFADYVHDELVGPRARAGAPNWNIDSVTLARHAEQARRRRARRDIALVLTLAFLVGVLELTAMGGVHGWFDLAWLAPALLGELAVGYVLAFAVVWSHYAAIHRSAVAVVDGRPVDGRPAEEPDPLPPATEQELVDETDANVVMFSGRDPFIGSGTKLSSWSLTTDISQGREGKPPQPFDALELQTSLLDCLPRTISPAPRSGRRLYVLGYDTGPLTRFVRSGPMSPETAAAGRFRRPVATITDEQMDEFVRDPDPAARPYAFFELTGWDGEVVVTLFVRVVVESPILFVEIAVCALRPLRGRFADALLIPLGPGVHHLPILRSVAPRAFPLLLASPLRTWSRATRRHREARRRSEVDRLVARHRSLDFSAGASLRERVAAADNDQHFGFIDEQMYLRFFSRRSLDCVHDFLVSNGVDTTEFEKQQNVIVQQTVVNATNSAISLGSGAMSSNTVSSSGSQN